MYVLLIYQDWAKVSDGKLYGEMSDEEKQSFAAEYAAINETPGVTPGAPLGLPDVATTVRVEDGEAITSDGPFAGAEAAVGGYYVLDADDLDAAIEMASRIPAARLGGAVEIRPVGAYW
jgi:hypothetical protein